MVTEDKCTPYEYMLDVLNQERYADIKGIKKARWFLLSRLNFRMGDLFGNIRMKQCGFKCF